MATVYRSSKFLDNSHPSLGSAAYQAIYAKIISLDYAPGQYLEEAALVEDLNIGRTPVREALLQLSYEGLVSTAPRSSVRIRAFSASVMREEGVATASAPTAEPDPSKNGIAMPVTSSSKLCPAIP